MEYQYQSAEAGFPATIRGSVKERDAKGCMNPADYDQTEENMKNVLLTIAYDGTGFCGWQRQPGQRSVQGEVERVLSQLCGQTIQINGTSRTDAGVHAYGQRANFIADFKIPIEKITIAANGLLAASEKGRNRRCAGDVFLVKAEEVPIEFHARFQAVGKKYIYRISNSHTPDLFQRDYRYQIQKTLDIRAMKKAAEFIKGTHDFKCFQAAGGKELESTVRTVYGICLSVRDKPHELFGTLGFGYEIDLEIIGDGFLYNMVRIIAGTLVDVGLRRKSPEDLPEIIAGRKRQQAGHTAPPQGLYLHEVFFDRERLDNAADLINRG